MLMRSLNPLDRDSSKTRLPPSPQQASSSEDMGRWIGILLAETGSSTDPGALHYDYIDVEMSANVIQTAKQTFW